MATGAIKSTSATIVYLESSTSGVDVYGRLVYDPATATVRIYIAVSSSSNLSADTVLATIPSGYRPKQTEALYGMFTNASGAFSAYYGRANTDGTIKQSYSSTTRALAMFGEYKI